MRLGTGLATAKLGGTAVASIRRGSSTVYDADATTYLKAVEAADGQGLEPAVAKAIQDFVVGLKATSAGIAADPTRTLWDAVQASCIMCGARTIAGALVPLKGTAPTPYNLVNFDYTRTGGIEGDGSSTYLDSNRSNDADVEDDVHQSVYVSALPATTGTTLIGNYSALGTKGSLMSVEAANAFGTRCNDASLDTSATTSVGLCGINRESSSEYDKRTGGTTSPVIAASLTPTSITNTVFALNGDSSVFGPYKTNARLAFYSIGSALDLAALDTKVTALVAAVSAALA